MYKEKVCNLSPLPAPHFHPSEITTVISLVYIFPYLSPGSYVNGCFVYVCGFYVLSQVELYFIILPFIFPTK